MLCVYIDDLRLFNEISCRYSLIIKLNTDTGQTIHHIFLFNESHSIYQT